MSTEPVGTGMNLRMQEIQESNRLYGESLIEVTVLAACANAEETGMLLGIREVIVSVGTKRFGDPPAFVVQALDSIDSFKAIRTIVDRLLDAASWQDLLA